MATVEHISINPKVCGGKPCIAGTRIRVWDIYVWYERGESPNQIVDKFPQLSLADVYAALAYFFDHRAEIEQQMKESDAFADEMRRKQGPTKLDQLKKERGLDDSFSFG